jgi:hypothetical protein
VMRHRCKRYLMAKSAEMKKYEEIYCKTYWIIDTIYFAIPSNVNQGRTSW